MKSPGGANRLQPTPTQIIDRAKVIELEVDGRTLQAYEGDTVASAMFADGVETFSRSFKYHRPRGLLCVAGRCANCLVNVDGVPNVRACTERVQRGTRVRRQNAWPSVDRDALVVLDRLDRLMPVGFYYKSFHRSKLLWKLVQPMIRRIAGLGALETESVPESHFGHRNLHTQVAVVGGGPAGLSAALEAAAAGATVTLIDDQPALGGSLRFDAKTYRDVAGLDAISGPDLATALAERVHSSSSIDVLSCATAFGLYEGGLLGILADKHLIKLRAQRIVVASGSYEVPTLFEGNDLPGVMLATGAQRLMHLYGIRPGDTAVVVTANDLGYDVATELIEAGVRVAAVVDSRPEGPGPVSADALHSGGATVLMSHVVIRAEGRKHVESAVVARTGGGQGRDAERRIPCDLLCIAGGFQPASSLLYQAGCGHRYDETLDEVVPRELTPALFVAGEVTGLHDLEASLLQGRAAGFQAAASLGRSAPASGADWASLRDQVAVAEERYRRELKPGVQPAASSVGRKGFVCLCEDVTSKDVSTAIDEGFDDIQTLKRYSTVTMGPCQGKMCHGALVRLCAERTGRGIDDTGATTSRPPVQPVPLAALAGLSHMPIKRTPMDRKHRDLGAPIVDLGPWQRAYSYGSPQNECLAVRERVGMIDVSTLGKLDVQGRDAPALLDKVYTHRFSDLRVGRIRYGVLCSDNGAILDDGTVARLAEDRYFVTTTTGNVESIEEWFKWWTAGNGLCAHVTNVTSAFGAINVAGPRARETLAKLTDLDLSSNATRYMRSVQATVAGVQTLLLRIGFVGETGWELHFPAEYGEHMWDALIEAGAEFGIMPFGLEAQRILRLEKRHLIVGQDTDAVSTPLDSDMDWVVRFDKDDFIGRGGLLAAKERGPRDRLVGFVMRDGVVPEDGDPVVADGAPVGRVTSARLSPTLGKGFGMAWVPAGFAAEGHKIHIRVDQSDLPAAVTLQAVYDPEGLRLRE